MFNDLHFGLCQLILQISGLPLQLLILSSKIVKLDAGGVHSAAPATQGPICVLDLGEIKTLKVSLW